MKNILIIQLRQLGDILLTTPLVSEIKRQIPDSRVSWLTHPMGRLVLAGNPDLDQEIYYPADGAWRPTWELIRELRRQNFDVIIDSMNNPRSAFFTLAIGCGTAARRIGFAGRRRMIYHDRCSFGGEPCYIVDEKFRLLGPLGIRGEPAGLTLPWGDADSRLFCEVAASIPPLATSRLRVVLSPTHRHEVRRWPVDAYAGLADWLTTQWGAAVTWIWGPGEEQTVDAAMSLCRQKSFKAPRTSLRELAAWIAHCDLFIGNSNGPSHIAVAVATPSLQLHGPTQAISWCPMTPMHRAIQTPSVAGAMEGITLEAVQRQLELMHELVMRHSLWRSAHAPWRDWLAKRSRLPF